VPTVSDRIAQIVVKRLIEPDLDTMFLPDSYGYWPGKSALDAVGVTRKHCWRYDCVLELGAPLDNGVKVGATIEHSSDTLSMGLAIARPTDHGTRQRKCLRHCL